MRTIVKSFTDFYKSQQFTFQIRTRPPFRADNHFATEFERSLSTLNAGDPPPYHFNVRKYPWTSGMIESDCKLYLVPRALNHDRTDRNRPSAMLVMVTPESGYLSELSTVSKVILGFGTCLVSIPL